MKPLDQLSDADLERLARRAAALPDAPPGLVNRAIGLWPARAASQPSSAGASVRRLIAGILSFDSWMPAPLPAGVRAVPSDVRHLLFSASGRDVDLRIEPAADRFTLSGQILGPDESGSVELVRQESAEPATAQAQVATLDDLGTFRLEAVARGSYRLTLRVGTDDIVLPPIDIGERER